jgi:tetratricopeptide (TPR) repeat protein
MRAKRDPLLAEGRQAEQSNEYSKAYRLYQQATQVDPNHPEGYAGMNRVRSMLHNRAKVIYTEAVLAESYSDFATAEKKFRECLEISPSDDVYYERSQRKLVRYTHMPREGSGGGG